MTTVITGPGSDFAKEATLEEFVGPYSEPLIGIHATTGPVTLLSPAAGKRLIVRRVWIKGAANIPDGDSVEFSLKLGTTLIANDDVIASQPYADGVVKVGEVDADLVFELMQANKVFYNIAVEEL